MTTSPASGDRAAATEQPAEQATAQGNEEPTEQPTDEEKADRTTVLPAADPEPADPAQAPTGRALPEPTGPRITTPPKGEDVVHFPTRGSSAALTVVLALGALAGAAFAIYQAYQDRLGDKPGLIAMGVTLVLVFMVSRTRAGGTTVSIERGVIAVEDEDGLRRFDITSPGTLVQEIGTPGERGWKIVLVFEAKPSFSLDDSMVDPVAFSRALRRWRPDL